MEFHKCWGQGDNHFPGPSKCAPVITHQEVLGLLCCQDTMLAYAQLSIYQHSHVLLSRDAPLLVRSQPLSLFQRCFSAVTTCRALVPLDVCQATCICVHTLGMGVLSLCFIILVFLFPSTCFLGCLPLPITFSHNCGLQYLSLDVIGLELSSTGWPPCCWQRCFCPTLSVGSHDSSAAFNPQRSCGHKKQILANDISCATRYWPPGYNHS